MDNTSERRSCSKLHERCGRQLGPCSVVDRGRGSGVSSQGSRTGAMADHA